jgi:hypothetical protein
MLKRHLVLDTCIDIFTKVANDRRCHATVDRLGSNALEIQMLSDPLILVFRDNFDVDRCRSGNRSGRSKPPVRLALVDTIKKGKPYLEELYLSITVSLMNGFYRLYFQYGEQDFS